MDERENFLDLLRELHRRVGQMNRSITAAGVLVKEGKLSPLAARKFVDSVVPGCLEVLETEILIVPELEPTE